MQTSVRGKPSTTASAPSLPRPAQHTPPAARPALPASHAHAPMHSGCELEKRAVDVVHRPQERHDCRTHLRRGTKLQRHRMRRALEKQRSRRSEGHSAIHEGRGSTDQRDHGGGRDLICKLGDALLSGTLATPERAQWGAGLRGTEGQRDLLCELGGALLSSGHLRVIKCARCLAVLRQAHVCLRTAHTARRHWAFLRLSPVCLFAPNPAATPYLVWQRARPVVAWWWDG